LNGVRAVAAGATCIKDISHRSGSGVARARMVRGEAHHFRGPLALERKRHEQRGHVRRLGFSVHDARHGAFRSAEVRSS
jgi:hypothetical protein